MMNPRTLRALAAAMRETGVATVITPDFTIHMEKGYPYLDDSQDSSDDSADGNVRDAIEMLFGDRIE